MNWLNYKREFVEKALEQNKTQKYIDKWLNYAKVLHDKDLPIIYNAEHLSKLIGLDLFYLMSASNKPKLFYRKFKIPKKTGGFRVIHEPLPDLKKIQKWIATEILANCEVSEFTKAYRVNRSIKDNARFHVNQKLILNIDIEDYFHSIDFYSVKNFFESLGYNKRVSVLIANLCCLNNGLPQGGTTSPSLSNLITLELDRTLSNYCMDENLRYTRYADDITISGDFIPRKVIRFVKKTLGEYGFKTNNKKTKIKRNYERQTVTGITVNKKMQVPLKYRKELRQIMYYIKKFSLESHMEQKQILLTKEQYLKHLLGKAHFIIHINKKDEEAIGYIKELNRLLKKY